MLDGLQEILFTLKQNKLRTLLTAFGVFWGIFMLMLMLGAGKGMQNGVYDSFGTNVMDFIVVYTGTTAIAHNGLGVGRHIQLTEDDVQAIKQKIPQIGFISSINQKSGVTISYEEKSGSFELNGIPDDYFNIKGSIFFDLGRKLNPFDIQQNRKICELGVPVAEKIFGKDIDPVGKDVRVNGVILKVIGVFKDKGNNGRDAEKIYIPSSTFKNIYGSGNQISNIWLRPAEGIDGFELEKKVIALLQKRHDVSPEDKRAIKSFNMAEPAKMVKGLFLGITTIIWFVGLGTLSAGIVGISNIMIITVKERTREIGIRKALGATPLSIVSTLLMESILVTSIAGYIGMLLGIGILELVSFVLRSSGASMAFFKNPEVDFSLAITAIILLVVVGALAGLVPAIRAAKIMPIEAMRAN